MYIILERLMLGAYRTQTVMGKEPLLVLVKAFEISSVFLASLV